MEDEDEDCAQCFSNKKISPTLQLLYSTCCGYRLCAGCADKNKDLSKGGTFECRGCTSRITRSNFRKETLEQQRFSAEFEERKRLAKTFVKEARDFKTMEEYNDYLEFEQEIVYDRLYGTKEEKERALLKVKEFERKNRTQLQDIRARKVREERAAAGLQDQDSTNQTTNSLNGEGGGGGGVGVGGVGGVGGVALAHSFPPAKPLPGQVTAANQLTPTLLAIEHKQLLDEDRTARADQTENGAKKRAKIKARLAELRTLEAGGGGFLQYNDTTRSLQEAFAGVFD